MVSRSGLGAPVVGTLASMLVLISFLVLISSAAAADANMESCPNALSPGFTAYLPDCRAYELVSPPFKDGQQLGNVLAVSSDGSRMLAESLGVFAGTESDSEDGAVYQFTRSASDWTTSAVSPAASVFPTDLYVSASAALGRTLWAVRGASESIYAEDLYAREPDGTFVRVGPMVPPSAELGPPPGGHNLLPEGYIYSGASSDLSHVLFAIRASRALWPGDTTVESTATSLYEYVGAGNQQPQLVGIDAERHLISNCGTALGLEEQDEYNAISANGQTVVFTSLGHSASGCEPTTSAPEVSELYARLNQIQTVGISEPAPGQCGECNSTVKAPAEFQGASEDGSKVFFLTEQELFAGDTTENLYEYAFSNRNGQKIVRVSGGSPTPEVQGVARVSEDGSHVYFVAKGVLTEGKNDEGREPVSGGENLYVFERDAAHPSGNLRFVATLSEGDNSDWNVQDIRPVQATPDGRFLVFESVADLTPVDTSTEPQVFEYDALEQKLVRISIGQAGYPEGTTNANASGSRIPSQLYSESRPTTAGTGLAVSANGSIVVFTSSGGLTPQALNHVGVERCTFEEHGVCVEHETEYAENVYEYRGGNVYLVSGGQTTTGSFGSRAVGASASGGDVFFRTADPLLAQDVDTQFDVYDARSDGGFSAPVSPVGCEGEACLPGLSAVPVLGSAGGSVAAKGGGNLTPPAVVSPPNTKAKAKAKAKPLTRAQKLAKALKACGKKPPKQRSVCRARAEKTFGGRSNAKGKGRSNAKGKSTGRGGTG